MDVEKCQSKMSDTSVKTASILTFVKIAIKIMSLKRKNLRLYIQQVTRAIITLLNLCFLKLIKTIKTIP